MGGEQIIQQRQTQQESQKVHELFSLLARGARTGTGQARNPADGVGVSDEVLPEGPAGLEAVRRQQLCDVGAGEGHQEIVTSTTPWLRSPICEKPEGDMSTTRG